MKIDDAIIDKVLNNEASAEEAGKVAECLLQRKEAAICRNGWKMNLCG